MFDVSEKYYLALKASGDDFHNTVEKAIRMATEIFDKASEKFLADITEAHQTFELAAEHKLRVFRGLEQNGVESGTKVNAAETQAETQTAEAVNSGDSGDRAEPSLDVTREALQPFADAAHVPVAAVAESYQAALIAARAARAGGTVSNIPHFEPIPPGREVEQDRQI